MRSSRRREDNLPPRVTSTRASRRLASLRPPAGSAGRGALDTGVRRPIARPKRTRPRGSAGQAPGPSYRILPGDNEAATTASRCWCPEGPTTLPFAATDRPHRRALRSVNPPRDGVVPPVDRPSRRCRSRRVANTIEEQRSGHATLTRPAMRPLRHPARSRFPGARPADAADDGLDTMATRRSTKRRSGFGTSGDTRGSSRASGRLASAPWRRGDHAGRPRDHRDPRGLPHARLRARPDRLAGHGPRRQRRRRRRRRRGRCDRDRRGHAARPQPRLHQGRVRSQRRRRRARRRHPLHPDRHQQRHRPAHDVP